MATITPLRWPRRTRGGMLAASCLLLGLVGLVAIGWVARSAVSRQPIPAPSGPLEAAQTLLRPGTIVFQMHNDGAHAVTIAQVSINDAFWPFTARPRTTITPHGTAVVTLGYPWDAGVAYEVQFVTSTGGTYVTTIDAATTASAAPSP